MSRPVRSAQPDHHQSLVVVDMSSLVVDLDYGRGSAAVRSGSEVLSTIPFRLLSDHVRLHLGPQMPKDVRLELVFEVLDRTLGAGRLTRADENGLVGRLPVGLYNPYTAEVAVDPVPGTRAYSSGSPLRLSADGVVCRLDRTELVWPDGTVLSEQDRTFSQMTRVFASHLT